jgi:hypothetical protein
VYAGEVSGLFEARWLSVSPRRLLGHGLGRIGRNDRVLQRGQAHGRWFARELGRGRGAAKDGGTLEYVFEAAEQNSPNAIN